MFHIFYDSGGITGGYGVVRDIFGDDAAGADDCAFTDSNAAHDGGVGADGCALSDYRRDDLPVLFRLKAAGFNGGARIAVVDKHHAVADKGFVFDGHAFADKRMALDFAVFADKSVFLDLDKGSYFGPVPDGAAIEINEIAEKNVFA